jgi:alpha-ketoglutarate-dependent taurine dioxygenase
MQITKLSEHIGAEVTGIDLNQPVHPAAVDMLHAAIVDNIALVIREQPLAILASRCRSST